MSTKHGLPRSRKPGLTHAEITLTKIADIGDALCSYDHAEEGLGIKVVQPALDYFVIHSGGNDQCDIEITSLAELLPCNLGVDQSRDCDERCPDRAEAAGRYSSVMNGQTEFQPRPSIYAVDIGDAGSELARIVRPGTCVFSLARIPGTNRFMMSLCLSVNPPAPTGNEPNRAHGIPAPWQVAKPS